MIYTIQEGDTLEQIARKQLGNPILSGLLRELYWKKIPNAAVLPAGESIYLPGSEAELEQAFMQVAIQLGRTGMEENEGGPFGAIVVCEGEIIGRGNNQVTSSNDPTAHAEVLAIRHACAHLQNFVLHDCVIYTSCEPCPMCLGAIYWARIERIVYAGTRHDAAQYGFSDEDIYRECTVPLHERTIPIENVAREEALAMFRAWDKKTDKTLY